MDRIGALSLAESGLMLRLLGPPEVVCAGRLLALPRRQVRALLYRLAVAQGPVPRDRLCFLFWPDRPDAEARRALARVLALLRRDLPDPGVLVADAEQVGPRPGMVWSDIEVFGRFTATAEAPRREELLQQAVDLYRGPLLDGFALADAAEFEEWLAGERGRWERRYLEALAALIELRTARGDHAAAIATAERYL